MGESPTSTGRWHFVGGSRFWLIVALLIVAFRAAAELTYPIYRDQATYCAIGQSLLDGKLLYRDLWDNKPPGIFYLYALIVKVFGRVMWSVGVVDLFCLFVISYFIFRFAERYLGTAPAVIAVVFNAAWHVQGGNLVVAQPETFLVLFVFIAYFLVAGEGAWVVPRYIASGLLFAAAFWVKYNALAFLPFLLFVPHVDWAALDASQRRLVLKLPWKDWLLRNAALLAAFGGAAGLVLGLFWVTGSWPYMKEIQFEVLPRYAAEVFKAVPNYWFLVLDQTNSTLGSLTQAAAAATLGIAWKQRRVGRCGPVLLGAAFGYLSVTMQVRFHDYYFQPCLPFLAMFWGFVLTAAYEGLRALLRTFAARRWNLARVLLWLVAANVVYWPLPEQAAALTLDYIALRDWWRDRMLFYSTSSWARPIDHFGDQLRVIQFLKENSNPGDGVFVWGTDPLIYFLSDGRPPTRFVTNLGLMSYWSPSSWREELVRDLKKSPPRFVVVARTDQVYMITLTVLDSEGYLKKYPALAEYISRNYRPVKELVYFVVYCRVEPSETSTKQDLGATRRTRQAR
jgi:dolichyl-phosphate-mannose-protein mannosyltransferase